MARILAFDYGNKRIGIACTDNLKIIAQGLITIHPKEIIEFLKKYLLQEEVELFVVGEPKQLDGTLSQAHPQVISFCNLLKKQFPQIKVELFDERFTSKMASQVISKAGLKKKSRENKQLIDTVAATIILQSYLEKQSLL